MASRGEKPACLIVCSGHSKGVSAQSFIHAFTLTSSTFNVFIATPEGKQMEFVDVDENNRQWVSDFRSKPFSQPLKLESIDSSRFIALLIPSCPGALFDLAANHYLAALLNAFLREKKPMCAVGYGVGGFFSTVDRQSQQWSFREHSLTAPSTFEIARREDFASLPATPSDFIRKHGATFSAGKAGRVHVVVDSHLVTGQNEQSTLAAVQNLILLTNARLTRPR